MIEVNKKGYEQLKDIHAITRKEANKNPDKTNKSYILDSGKQFAYSHLYYELSLILKAMHETPKGYINWKPLNLIIGFFIGILVTILFLKGWP